MSTRKITQKEQEVLKIVKDPVLWVTEHIGKPRWYQELVLRHPHHRTVLRMGRRLGKCIAHDQRILDPDTGRYTSIQSLYDRNIQQPTLYSLDGDERVKTQAFHIEDNGIKEVFRVTTADGSSVKLTGNHPVLTRRGWIDVDDLQKDDDLALPTALPYTGTEQVSKEDIDSHVQKTKVIPDSIYEWTEESLETFLTTYLDTYGYAGLSGGTFLLFQSEEVARDMKHLSLRTGRLSSIKEVKTSDAEEKLYSIDIYETEDQHGDLIFRKLQSVTSLGKEQTYDVHVPETHNLVVEDVYVHNTWTMTSHMLWVAMTNWGGRLADRKALDILVVTPYDVQAKEIYDKLLEAIQENEALSASLDYNKQGPPREIKFHNGNTIKLFTAGTSSSSNAASLRGQRADYVYLDEADYLSDGDYRTIYPLTQEDPDNVGMMMASTPSGKRGFFYKNSMEEKFNLDDEVKPMNTKELGYIYDDRTYSRERSTGFKEFHFPSHVSPHWGPRMEAELRSQFDSVGYEHEVMAEFGTEMEGVFSKDFVDEAASKKYSLEHYPKESGPIAIGVDYDKFGAQSNIVVLQYNHHDQRRVREEMGNTKEDTGYGRFKVINRIEIPKAENHYDLTVKRIIELDKQYHPFVIVPDKGQGDTYYPLKSTI